MRLCYWCKYLEFEEPHALSEHTWSSGKLICLRGEFEPYYSDNPLDMTPTLFKIIHTALDCDEYSVKEELKEVVK